MKSDILSVKEILLRKGISASHQRVKILQYLIEKKNHPTVEMIFNDLSAEMEIISKATVYNTLNLFIQKGVILQLTIDEGESRYDADTGIHGHFKCESCGKIEDVEIKISAMDIRSIQGYNIEEQHIYLKGKCSECVLKEDEKKI